MKTLQILGKILSAFLIAFGFGSCTPDCITCSFTYDGETYSETVCEADGWDVEYGSSWKDYIDYLKKYYKALGGGAKCK